MTQTTHPTKSLVVSPHYEGADVAILRGERGLRVATVHMALEHGVNFDLANAFAAAPEALAALKAVREYVALFASKGSEQAQGHMQAIDAALAKAGGA